MTPSRLNPGKTFVFRLTSKAPPETQKVYAYCDTGKFKNENIEDAYLTREAGIFSAISCRPLIGFTPAPNPELTKLLPFKRIGMLLEELDKFKEQEWITNNVYKTLRGDLRSLIGDKVNRDNHIKDIIKKIDSLSEDKLSIEARSILTTHLMLSLDQD
jgi:hypothetical protein